MAWHWCRLCKGTGGPLYTDCDEGPCHAPGTCDPKRDAGVPDAQKSKGAQP